MKSIIIVFTLLILAGCTTQAVKSPKKRLVKKPEYAKVAVYRPDLKKCTIQVQKRLLKAVAKQCLFDRQTLNTQEGRLVMTMLGEHVGKQMLACLANVITSKCGDVWAIKQQHQGSIDFDWQGGFDCKYASLWTPPIQKVCAEFKEAKQ